MLDSNVKIAPLSRASNAFDIATNARTHFALIAFHPKSLWLDFEERNEMFADDIWVIVYVCGPEDEIDRMKKLCKLPDIQHVTDDPVVDFTNLENGAVGGEYFTWNYAELGPHEEGSHTFQFDTSGKVPRDIFEALAREFPTLEFEIDCQGSLGEFAICGRYNHPNLPDEFWDDKDNELRQSIELY